MGSKSKSFRERSLAFSKLQKEVRAMTERVHGYAIKQTGNGDAEYLEHVSDLIEALIDRADARGRVIGFASAAEFGLPLRHQGERCRQAAMQTGSDSIMVLYWAAVRRMHGHVSGASNEATVNAASASSKSAESTSEEDNCAKWKGPAEATLLRSGLCRLCEGLVVDSRCANGHNALIPVSEKHFRIVGEGLLSEAQELQCMECKAIWARYKHRLDPFAMWSIKDRQ